MTGRARPAKRNHFQEALSNKKGHSMLCHWHGIPAMKKMKPIHPGEILLEEFLEPMGISQNLLARETGMSPRRINEIVLGKRAITGDTAIRLGKFFGIEPEFWMNLQSRFDLETAEDQFSPKFKIAVGRYKELVKPEFRS